MSARRCAMLCLLLLLFFTVDINYVISQSTTNPTTVSSSSTSSPTIDENVGQCSDDDRVCPTSKACFQNYQICDSYDDCGTLFDEIECPSSLRICQPVTGNSSAFQRECTLFTQYVSARESNQGVDLPATDGTLYFTGPPDQYTYTAIDAISFSAMDFIVKEFGYLKVVTTPFSTTTNNTLDPVILVISNQVDWPVNTSDRYEISLRSPIRVDPSLADRIRLSVTYVADSTPSASNPYRPPTLLNLTSFSIRYRIYYDECASLREEESGETTDSNPCLQYARDYAIASNEAARVGVYCEPRERVQIVYDIYQECFVNPLPTQPWQSLPSTTEPTIMNATTSSPIFAAPCDQGKLVCPVSFGCYDRSHVCDSYDDCGTGFDESSCSLTDEEGTVCQEVEQNATLFNTHCVTVMPSSGPLTSDDITRRVYLFPVPETPRLYIDSITINTTAFAPNLEGDLYAMFNITTTDRRGNVVNNTILTAEFRVTFKGSLTHSLPLRAPLPLTFSDTDRIGVYILRTPEAIPPGLHNPYVDAVVGSGGLRMNFVQYQDGCAAVPDDSDFSSTGNSECLRAAWDFRKAAERASSMGLTCLPAERTHFISKMYIDCFDAPTIVQISSNYTVIPGQEVSLICAARGTPVPTVRWVVPETLEVAYEFTQTMTTSAVGITFTGNTAMQYRFECVAESYVGETRRINIVTILGELCVEKLEERDRFLAASDPNQSCPTVQETQQPFYSFQQRALVYRPSSSGLLFALSLPSYIFSFTYGNTIAALRVSVTVNDLIEGPSRRRRRDVVPMLQQRDFFSIAENRNTSVYTIHFRAPVNVTAFESVYISFTSLESSLGISSPDGPVILRYLECPEVMDRVRNVACYRIYDQWHGMEEELIELGCAKRTSPLFDLYQNCLGIADEPLREFPLTIPEVKLYDNFTLRCPIAGSIQSHWMKKTSREDVLPFIKPSFILGFEMFNSQNQGYYYCKGVGNDNETLATEPVLLAFKDASTLGFSITFDRPYVDFTDPLFRQLAFEFQFPIGNALFADPVLSQLLVGGRFGSGGFDVPIIINTRNGSMIVDYQASFSDGNGTDLIEGVTRALKDNLRISYAAPADIILDSILVGSVSSCPESVYIGSEGTLTFSSVGLDQIAESSEHCAVYTGNTPVPRAMRTCMGDFISTAYWADPVLSACFSENDDTNQVLGDIASAPIASGNVTEYSSDLAKVTNETSSITAEGLESIATSLENIVRVQDSSMEVTMNVINTVNNVLHVSDEDFVIAIDAEAPTRILDSLENQLTLFQTQGDGSNLTVVDESLAVVALNIPRTTLHEGLGFTTQGGVRSEDDVYNDVLLENSTMVFYDVDEIPVTEFEAAVIIPRGVLDSISFDNSGGGMVPITFFVFQNSRLFQSGDQQNTLERGRRQAVGSRIISATIEGFDIQNLPMGQEIETAFLELNVTDDDETIDARSCVFWDQTANGGEWSTRGCRREDLPGLHRIRCLCDHLTSFAVLLDVSGDINVFALDILSMIGCGVSSLCLVILLGTFICVKKLRSRQPQRIHMNLCVALLGLYIAFMVGIDLRYPTNGCVAAGFILHFFLLSSISWMLVEAVYMYLLFVKIHSGTVSKFLRISSVLAWGSPLIVCVIIVCIDREFYLGDDTYCFVQPGPVLYYSVLLPIAIVILINTIIFILVTYRLTCGRRTISANSSAYKKKSETWRRLMDLVAFTILLGLTWAFGFLAIGGARFLFNILFLVFNSLQGFFVFIMFGLRQKPVREEWLRCCRCRCREDESSRHSKQYMKSKPITSAVSSGQTGSTSGFDIPLEGRGYSTTTTSTMA